MNMDNFKKKHTVKRPSAAQLYTAGHVLSTTIATLCDMPSHKARALIGVLVDVRLWLNEQAEEQHQEEEAIAANVIPMEPTRKARKPFH
jgi:hypothetical protein